MDGARGRGGHSTTFNDREGLEFQKIEDNAINNFISEPTSVTKQIYQILNSTLGEEEQENLTDETLVSDTHIVPVLKSLKSVPVKIEPGKMLNINPNLAPNEQECLITILKKHKGAFAWEYTDMNGIPSNLCTHHIYIKSDSRPMCQPQLNEPQP